MATQRYQPSCDSEAEGITSGRQMCVLLDSMGEISKVLCGSETGVNKDHIADQRTLAYYSAKVLIRGMLL